MEESKLQPKEVTVLKKIREEMGLSQEALAYRIGCSVRTISRAEVGEREPQFTFQQWLNFQKLLKEKKIKPPSRLSDKVPA